MGLMLEMKSSNAVDVCVSSLSLGLYSLHPGQLCMWAVQNSRFPSFFLIACQIQEMFILNGMTPAAAITC